MVDHEQFRSPPASWDRRFGARPLPIRGHDPTAAAAPEVADRNGGSPGDDRRDPETGRVRNDGGFLEIGGLTDAATPSEFAHELYIDAANLRESLVDCSPERSLEVGCGYGRLTPWIAAHAEVHVAIDPERSLLSAARREYPDVRFARVRAEALPFPDDAFDLAVTWGVLNHVQSASIAEAADEIDRVVAADGTLVISEATAGTPDPRWEYRSVEEWRDLFASRELRWRTATERDEEPFRDPEREHVVMKFR